MFRNANLVKKRAEKTRAVQCVASVHKYFLSHAIGHMINETPTFSNCILCFTGATFSQKKLFCKREKLFIKTNLETTLWLIGKRPRFQSWFVFARDKMRLCCKRRGLHPLLHLHETELVVSACGHWDTTLGHCNQRVTSSIGALCICNFLRK